MSVTKFNPRRPSMKRTLQIRISPEQHENLKRLATWFDCTVSEIIRHGSDLAINELQQTVKDKEAIRDTQARDKVEALPLTERQDHLEVTMQLYGLAHKDSERERDISATMQAHINLWAENFRGQIEQLEADK